MELDSVFLRPLSHIIFHLVWSRKPAWDFSTFARNDGIDISKSLHKNKTEACTIANVDTCEHAHSFWISDKTAFPLCQCAALNTSFIESSAALVTATSSQNTLNHCHQSDLALPARPACFTFQPLILDPL